MAAPPKAIADLFGLDQVPDFPARCNIASSPSVAVIREGDAQIRRLDLQTEGGQPFAFAGLWERWEDPDRFGTAIESCTMNTTDANDLLRPIHDRMPVILAPEDYDRWLDPGERHTKELLPMLTPPEAEDLSMRPVSLYVNKVEHDGAKCVAPV